MEPTIRYTLVDFSSKSGMSDFCEELSRWINESAMLKSPMIIAKKNHSWHLFVTPYTPEKVIDTMSKLQIENSLPSVPNPIIETKGETPVTLPPPPGLSKNTQRVRNPPPGFLPVTNEKPELRNVSSMKNEVPVPDFHQSQDVRNEPFHNEHSRRQRRRFKTATMYSDNVDREPKLAKDAVLIFQKAYGLHGQKRVSHEALVEAVSAEFRCSRTAVYALLYG